MIYLDNSATTQPYPEVIEAFTKVATHYFGNPSSIHSLGSEAERLIYQSREIIGGLLSVKPSEVLFTSGGTEGNNLAIKGTALRYRSRGKHIITTSIEHASIQGTLNQLKTFGYEITYLPVNELGVITPDQVKKAIRKDTILVSVIHVNNEVGSIQPILEIGQLLNQYPQILFHVDHVQGIGKVSLHIKKSFIDLLTVSGHKFHGLKGTGFIYVKEGVQLDPLFTGGPQENERRAGTENVAGIVSMTKALRMTLDNSVQKIQHIDKMKNYILNFIKTSSFAVLNTPEVGSAPHIINFSIPGAKPEVIVHALENYNIFVSTKSACSSKQFSPSRILLEMGKTERIAASAIRVSMCDLNTMAEIEFFCKVLREIKEQNMVIMR